MLVVLEILDQLVFKVHQVLMDSKGSLDHPDLLVQLEILDQWDKLEIEV